MYSRSVCLSKLQHERAVQHRFRMKLPRFMALHHHSATIATPDVCPLVDRRRAITATPHVRSLVEQRWLNPRYEYILQSQGLCTGVGWVLTLGLIK